MRKLEEIGLVTGKRWSSVLGNTTRPAHRGLHNVTTTTVDGNFILNGVATPWPGHHGLPAADRCSCQCTVLSVTVVDDLEAEILGE